MITSIFDQGEVFRNQSILCMDCLEGLVNIPDEYCICDPPYNIGKDFGNDSDKQKMDEYLVWCERWIRECVF